MCGFMVVLDKTLSKKQFISHFNKIQYRGPDNTNIISDKFGLWGFHRLAIMDLSNHGNQPFNLNQKRLVCNGEIFNFKNLRNHLNHYSFFSLSDCEILLPLYETYGIEKMVSMLDGEFVFVLYDDLTKSLIAARDPLGIRPMFYGYLKTSGQITFSSEAKALIDLCENIMPFPPGHYYQNGKFICFNDISKVKVLINDDIDSITTHIKELLEEAVIKRLSSDAPLGFLLSGGLDSSLVCAIAAKNLKTPIYTYSIGMDTDPIDLKYAKQVSEYINSNHTEVIVNKHDVLNALKHVIYILESYDVTTIRASIGMYLLCKYIKENTHIKVLLTGEVSDELFGYKYTDFAPNEIAFQNESEKRIRELYVYDVLRADRCISSNSLEARVPFGDIKFVEYVLGINPKLKMNTYGMGKYLLRTAFENTHYLPNEILYREKAAFSDAIGHSLVDYLKEYAEKFYSVEDLENGILKYPKNAPFSKESLLYRNIFEEFYPQHEHFIGEYWMPNKEWVGCDVNDPSARVLTNYGNSGI